MADVKIYTTPWCGYCRRAKALLDRKSVSYQEIDVDNDLEKRRWLVEATGQSTVPQIFINGASVGGCDDLHELDRRGGLDRLLSVDAP